jgi:hypothetical protein
MELHAQFTINNNKSLMVSRYTCVWISQDELEKDLKFFVILAI